jgi:hypothetical protein
VGKAKDARARVDFGMQNEKKKDEMRCQATTLTGTQCKRSAQEGAQFCSQHADKGSGQSKAKPKPEAPKAKAQQPKTPRPQATSTLVFRPVLVRPRGIADIGKEIPEISPLHVKDPTTQKMVVERISEDFTNVRGIVADTLEALDNGVTGFSYDMDSDRIVLTLEKPVTPKERAYLACSVVDPNDAGPDGWMESDIYIVLPEDKVKQFPRGAELFVYLLDEQLQDYDCPALKQEDFSAIERRILAATRT